jgi:hypothetical protein
VRRVQQNGVIYWRNRSFFVGEAFYRFDVALRPTATDGSYAVYFCQQQVATVDLRDPKAQL